MKHTPKKILTVLAAGLLLAVKPAFSQSLEARTDVMSKYMLRGYELSTGAVIQPSITAGYKDATVIGFGNYDVQTKKLNEADIFADYTTPITDKLKVSMGVNFITFPNAQEGTPKNINELYGAISMTNTLNPKLMILNSFGDVKGQIAELSINPTVNIKGQDISTTVLLGFDKNYFNQGKGLSHAETKISTTIPIPGNISITPMMNYTKGFTEGFKDVVYGGVGLSLKY